MLVQVLITCQLKLLNNAEEEKILKLHEDVELKECSADDEDDVPSSVSANFCNSTTTPNPIKKNMVIHHVSVFSSYGVNKIKPLIITTVCFYKQFIRNKE